MRFTIIAVSIIALTACVSPKDFETDPVSVKTDEGTVVCQLYTHQKVMFDEAVSFPESMTKTQADRICIAKGEEVAKAWHDKRKKS